jgi:hypothetical protein
LEHLHFGRKYLLRVTAQPQIPRWHGLGRRVDAGIGRMTEDEGLPGYSGHLKDACATMAQVLRKAGNFMAMRVSGTLA